MYQKLVFLLLIFSLASAQEFAGIYLQENDPGTVLELQISTGGYTGTLVNSGAARYRVEAFTEDGMLFGTIYLTEAGLEQDLFFGAELVADSLELTTALIVADGVLDETSYAAYRFTRSGTPEQSAINPLQAPVGNPLASPPVAPADSTHPGNPLAAPVTPQASAPGTVNPIQADQIYQAGTTLSSAVTGVNFTLPAGFQGGYDSAEGFFLMVNQAQTELIMLQAASQLSASQLGQATLQTIADTLDENAIVQELSAPQQQADRFSASYLVNGNLYHLLVRQGSTGNALLILGVGTQAVSQTVEQFANSVTFTPPQTNAVSSPLGGMNLFSNRTDSYYSPGGAGNGSQASGTKRNFTFCSDGSYAFEYSYESFISVEGAGSVSSSDSDSHQGSYTLTQSLMGDLLVFLQAQDGRVFLPVLEQVPEGVLVDGLLYEPSQSQLCR